MDGDASPTPRSFFQQLVPLLPTYTHLLVAALFPIYAGAHASVRRPGNTLTPEEARALRPSSSLSDSESEDESEEDSASAPVENLTATDALLFPVTAGALLGGLYLLIKNFDPAILSQIMSYYFSAMGLLAVSKSISDLLALGTRVVFPRTYTTPAGVHRTGISSWEPAAPISTPIPALRFLPGSFSPFLWRIRRRLTQRYTLRLRLSTHRTTHTFATPTLLTPFISAAVIAAYTLLDKPWALTNVLGLSFSYQALQLLSPTTFPIATLLLFLLFFYDIFFVFYTPLMVTVATSLDAPIKLVFPRPGAGLAMLGLGDIVLPGLMVALALRFDCWCHYERLRRGLGGGVKPRWGRAVAYRKTYFRAAMWGYVLGLVCTLGVMQWWRHAQPALLYLVPSTVGAVWVTGLARGELGLLWMYTEAGEEVPEEEKKEDGKEAKEVKEKKVEEEGDVKLLEIELVKKGRRRGAVKREKVEVGEKVEVEEDEEESELSDDASTQGGAEGTEMWDTTIIGGDE